jgi:phosphate transport system permease protein
VSSRRTGDAGTWLLAGLAAACIAAMLALGAYVVASGFAAFWPQPLSEVRLRDGRVLLGEVVGGDAHAIALRGSERQRIGDGYQRIARADIVAHARPRDAILVAHADGRREFRQGDAAAAQESSGAALEVSRPNALSTYERLATTLRRAVRFVVTAPDATGVGGGVLPAVAGTLTLVVLMSLLVMPVGIAAAAFLHSQRGHAARLVRAAINTLAGVPSIVYGVLGLGLLVHGVGGSIDRLFHADRLPVPTYGGGGLLWAALTMALLTLPVVVISVEEGLQRIPASLRDGSLALGATREETLWRMSLPAARPAVLTGLILAVARTCGAVAPLMLVGVVELAPALPFDADFPYLHPTRQFMHLGFSIHDAALASADSIRGVPRAYACASLLIAVVVGLNLSAILLRNRLRERYRALET